jgi:hypothetical protein
MFPAAFGAIRVHVTAPFFGTKRRYEHRKLEVHAAHAAAARHRRSAVVLFRHFGDHCLVLAYCEGVRRLGSATKGLGTFGVSYHETFDFFWIKGTLRCEANNFLGYDFD